MPSKYLSEPFISICGVKALAGTGGDGHPVFLLLMEDDSGVVIKKDRGKAPALQHNLKIAAAISPEAKSKILVTSEVDAIKGYLQRYEAYMKFKLATEDDSIAYLRAHAVGAAVKSDDLWYKMDQVDGLTNVGAALKQLAGGCKTGIRDIAKALNAQGGFETLGRIVAADLYNQNRDRFQLNSNFGARDGDLFGNIRFRVLINPGNVMVCVQKHDRILLGLDSFDPNNQEYEDMSVKVKAQETFNTKWDGRYLSNTGLGRLGDYCQDIFDDFEELLGPRNRRFAFLNKNRLDPKGAQRIANGLLDGKKIIIEKLRAMVAKAGNNVSPGLTSRLKIITS